MGRRNGLFKDKNYMSYFFKPKSTHAKESFGLNAKPSTTGLDAANIHHRMKMQHNTRY